MTNKKILILFILSIIYTPLTAQELLSEGKILYKITVRDTSENVTAATQTSAMREGTMTFHIKNDYVRQDIEMGAGYHYARISNFATGKIIILQQLNGAKYAVEFKLRDRFKQQQQFYGASLLDGAAQENIAGHPARSAKLSYKNGQSFSFFYLPGLRVKNPEIFDRSPELTGIPARFDLPTSDGLITRFELVDITTELVPQQTFLIPEKYRIISKKEYERLIK